MKKLTIVNITQSGALVIEINPNTWREVTFQGFTINTDLEVRHHLDCIIGKQLQCTINKTNKLLRYQNETLFSTLLKKNALKINDKEMQGSKIYNEQQKASFKKIQQSKPLDQIQQINKQSNQQILVNDYVKNRQGLFKKFRKHQKITGKIEYLGQQIVIRQQVSQKQISFIPIQLLRIDHYFHSLPKTQFIQFLKKYQQIQIELHGTYYNLDLKSYQLRGSFPIEIQLQILKNGWATVTVLNAMHISSENLLKMRSTQITAKNSNFGIFKTVFELLSLIYTKNNLVGIIEDIHDGYIYQIRNNFDDTILKVELTHIYCPVGDQPGAYQCRQFARKNLIGKQVNVFLKKNQGLNMHGSISRLSESDVKDVETLMLQNGWAYVKQQLKGSLMVAKYQLLEKRAKQKGKGLHKKSIGVARFQDLTIWDIKKDPNFIGKRQAFLKDFLVPQEGVIESFIDPLVYKIRFQNRKVIIKVKLQGIAPLSMNPLLPQYQQFKNQVTLFMNKNFKKRTVLVSLTYYQKHINSFFGALKLVDNKKDFQQILLEQSYAYCDSDTCLDHRYFEIQNQQKKLGKRIWAQKLLPFQPKNILDEMPEMFKGKFSWVINGEKAYIQPQKNYDTIEKITSALQEKQLPKLKRQNLLVGVVCAAPYFGEYHRAKIEYIKNNTVKVYFVDWGNRQQLNLDQLCQLNINLQYIQPQCFLGVLHMLKPIKKNLECLEKVREQLEGQFKFTKYINNNLNVYKGQEHINLTFIEKGYMRVDSSKIIDKSYAQFLIECQQNFRRDQNWQFSEEDTSEQQDEKYKIKNSKQ